MAINKYMLNVSHQWQPHFYVMFCKRTTLRQKVYIFGSVCATIYDVPLAAPHYSRLWMQVKNEEVDHGRARAALSRSCIWTDKIAPREHSHNILFSGLKRRANSNSHDNNDDDECYDRGKEERCPPSRPPPSLQFDRRSVFGGGAWCAVYCYSNDGNSHSTLRVMLSCVSFVWTWRTQQNHQFCVCWLMRFPVSFPRRAERRK